MKPTILLAAAALAFSVSVNAQSTVDSIRAKYQLQQMPAPLTLEKTFPAIGTFQMSNMNNADEANSTVTITLDSVNKGMIWISGLPQGRLKAYLKKSPSTYRILSQKTETGKQVPEGTLIYDETTNTLNVALGMPFNDANPASVFTMSSISNNAAQDNKIKDDVTNTKVKFDKNDQAVKVKNKNTGTKVKTKLMVYSGTKNIPADQMNNNMNMQQDSTNMQQNNMNQQPTNPQQPANPQQPTSPQQPANPQQPNPQQ
jgi:hypothetical protein